MNPSSLASMIGWPVIHRAHGGDRTELGIIFGINSEFVFVRYVGDDQPKATKTTDLQLVPPHRNYGAAGTSLEDRARELTRAVLGGTTIDPTLIPEAVDKEWGYFMPLLT